MHEKHITLLKFTTEWTDTSDKRTAIRVLRNILQCGIADAKAMVEGNLISLSELSVEDRTTLVTTLFGFFEEVDIEVGCNDSKSYSLSLNVQSPVKAFVECARLLSATWAPEPTEDSETRRFLVRQFDEAVEKV